MWHLWTCRFASMMHSVISSIQLLLLLFLGVLECPPTTRHILFIRAIRGCAGVGSGVGTGPPRLHPCASAVLTLQIILPLLFFITRMVEFPGGIPNSEDLLTARPPLNSEILIILIILIPSNSIIHQLNILHIPLILKKLPRWRIKTNTTPTMNIQNRDMILMLYNKL